MVFEKNVDLKFPKIIEFQINSICNSHCTICPYSTIEKKYGNTKMSDNDIDKLITEMDNYSKEIERIIPYLNNEPFIDSRFINVLRRLKNKKNHYIEVSTNASLLTEDISRIIVEEKLIDDFRISFFAGNSKDYQKLMPKLNFEKNIENIRNFIKVNNNSIKYQITLILVPWMNMEENINQVKKIFPNANIHLSGFLDRAGNLEQKNDLIINENDDVLLAGCNLNRPFERMCILSNGDVILCSQDWDRNIIQGNVLKTSIYDVWNSDNARNIRNQILGKVKIPNNYICRKCKLALFSDNTEEKLLNFKGDKYMDEHDRKRRI